MDFIAIDFETANPKRYSACSLAITVVKNSEVVDELYSLIKPPTPFSHYNSAIHHIDEHQVKNAPNFLELWDVIDGLFTPNQLVVAHNLAFDKSVLTKTLEYYHQVVPQFLCLDTLKTSRKLLPALNNYKLNTVCDYFNIDLLHHHNALDDSLACANILLAQEQHFGIDAISPFIAPNR